MAYGERDDSARRAATSAQGSPSSPELIAARLGRLSPRQEKKAFAVLRGEGERVSAGSLAVLAVAACVAGAGGAYYLARRTARPGALELSAEGRAGETALAGLPPVAPPEEVAAPRGEAPGAGGPPTFRVRPSAPRAPWVEIGGPLLDFEVARPVGVAEP
jgi:hypothetical protein